MISAPGRSTGVTGATWASWNQAWLAQRIAGWRGALHDAAVEPHAAADSAPGDRDDEFVPAAVTLRALFRLTPFERDLLVLLAGVETDRHLGDAVARAQAGTGADARVSFALALALVAEPHWDALSPSRPLRHWLLVHVDETQALVRTPLRIDERVLHFLTGVSAMDERLRGVAWLDDDAGTEAPCDLARRMATSLEGGGDSRRPLIVLSEALVDGARTRAARAAVRQAYQEQALRTLWVDAGAMPSDPVALDEMTRRLDREAALSSAGIALTVDGVDAPFARRLIRSLRSPVVALGHLDPLHVGELEQRRVVRMMSPSPAARPVGFPAPLQRAVDRAFEQFHVDSTFVEQAISRVSEADDEDAVETHVWQALREAARGGLDVLALRIESRATFEDLVVPPHILLQLREIAAQLRHRHVVHGRWGFGARNQRGLGLAALFSGESGTGKTLAAEAIANETRLDLYRVDLASVVSKYIGETEKNLARLFAAAEQSGAILLFDEADALFGKRSEVRDSHDRYANIDIAYLLQRIETYRGLAILTTNMKSALDRAFLRRIRFVIEFPFPDAGAREEIWRRELPERAPIASVDFRALGGLRVTGGNIRTIALNAAFLAADRGTPIDTAVLMDAAHRELAKLERSPSPMGRGR